MIEDVGEHLVRDVTSGSYPARVTATAPDRPLVGWSVVLPFKGGPNAKSRLGLGSATGLATAIALDCLDAVLAARAVSSVVVVTSDPALATAAAAAGAGVRGESRPGDGLLAAIGDGLVGLDGPCAVLLGDLAALRPADLDLALQNAWQALTTPSGDASRPPGAPQRPGMVFVPDADGIGTVLLAAAHPDAMTPSFGPESARRHAESGARRLDLDLPSLRRDVDTPADLDTARALGLGPRTRAFFS